MPSVDASGPLATVVVLNWNGRELLSDCLDTLAKQDLDPAMWQTWVPDNGSTDGSVELLTRRYPQVRVLENGVNLGFAGGNNVALRAVDTPFVVLLNNDAYPEPDWLRRLLDAAQDDDDIGAVTSKLLFEPRFLTLDFETPEFRAPADPRALGAQLLAVSVDGVDVTDEVLWQHGVYGVEQYGERRLRWSFPRGRLTLPVRSSSARDGTGRPLRIVVRACADTTKPLTLRWAGGEATVQLTPDDADHEITVPASTALVDVVNNVGSYIHRPGYAADRGFQEADTGQYDQAEDVFLFCGAAVCLRTEALRQVGVFDDDFFMYYEDTDLSWRLQAAGWRVRYAPDAVVRHLHAASSGEWSPFFTFHVERNRLLVFTKNAPARFAAWLVLRFNLTTASMARRVLFQAIRQRRRPSLGALRMRLKIIASYLRLLPRALRNRRRRRGLARHTPQQLFDRWMLPEKPRVS